MKIILQSLSFLCGLGLFPAPFFVGLYRYGGRLLQLYLEFFWIEMAGCGVLFAPVFWMAYDLTKGELSDEYK